MIKTEERSQARIGQQQEHYASRSRSGRFWESASPEMLEAIRRHNERLGTWLQLLVSRFICAYLVGIPAYLYQRLVLRLQVVGQERVGRANGSVIYALRHFYEWDPFLTYYAIQLPWGFAWPTATAVSLAGHFWMKTRLRRCLSYCVSVMGLMRGQEQQQGAIARACQLLQGPAPVTIGIFPTGPIGQRQAYDVRPGVAYLALRNPDVPVIPVTVIGLQEAGWRGLLRFWDPPKLVVAVGEPLYGRDFAAGGHPDPVAAICGTIADRWTAEELRHQPQPEQELALCRVEQRAD